MGGNKLLFVVGSRPGSGGTTFCENLERIMESYGLSGEFIYAGEVFRNLAKKEKLSLVDFHKKAEIDHSIDKYVDELVFTKAISSIKNKDFVIVQGRVQPVLFNLKKLLIPHYVRLITIWIEVSPEIGAKRIAKRDKKEYRLALKEWFEREESNSRRYKDLYNINYPEEVKAISNFVFDTTYIDSEEMWRDLTFKFGEIMYKQFFLK